MKITRLAILGVLSWTACGGSAPSAPSQTTTIVTAGFTISGTVYVLDGAGRVPLIGATVELADSATAAWGQYGRPITDAAGRFAVGSLTARHYLARASKTGYDTSAIVSLGFVEASRTVDFELTSPATTTAPLSVAAISPTVGSTGGGTTVRITGTGFRPGTTVTFDGGTAGIYIENSMTLQVIAPVHAVGAVDVVVTRSDGQTVRLPGAYRYAPAQSFDFNGTWVGYALAHPAQLGRVTARHSDMDMRFTVQSNVLTGVTCGGVQIAATLFPSSVINGEFSLVGDAVTLSGRIVSADEAAGAINTASCPATRWAATKQ